MKLIFLSAQATYAQVEIVLFKNNSYIDTIFRQDVRASSHLIPYFDEILKRNSLFLQDLDFIAIDRGPGAFTSLRTAVATVNGIGFTQKVPIIGIDSLDALTLDVIAILKEQKELTKPTLIVALLNAYNNDVYYAISHVEAALDYKHKVRVSGYKKIDALLADLALDASSEKIIFAGNGSTLHQELIVTKLGGKKIVSIQQDTPTAQSIGLLALELHGQGNIPCYRIEPNYVKSQYFAIQKPFNVPQT